MSALLNGKNKNQLENESQLELILIDFPRTFHLDLILLDYII